jgi:hypothetical protein
MKIFARIYYSNKLVLTLVKKRAVSNIFNINNLVRMCHHIMKNELSFDFRFTNCVWVTMQFGVLHNPNVTHSKFIRSFGHPLTA